MRLRMQLQAQVQLFLPSLLSQLRLQFHHRSYNPKAPSPFRPSSLARPEIWTSLRPPSLILLLSNHHLDIVSALLYKTRRQFREPSIFYTSLQANQASKQSKATTAHNQNNPLRTNQLETPSGIPLSSRSNPSWPLTALRRKKSIARRIRKDSQGHTRTSSVDHQAYQFQSHSLDH